jgi:hypothetical protein
MKMKTIDIQHFCHLLVFPTLINIFSVAMFLENCSHDQKHLYVVIKVIHPPLLLRMGASGG